MVNRPVRRRLIKMLGSLPVVAHFAHRLQVGRIVARHCPSRDNAHLTHAQVVLAVLANRLIQPRAMYRLLDWARQWAVGETFSFDATKLNDDRLGRCLTALAPHLNVIQGEVLAQAVTEFDLDLRQLHWDLTSVVLEGTYDPADPPPEPVARGAQQTYPQPAYGYGGVSDKKQLRVGELVTSDGSVPIFHRAFDGNQADVGTVVAVMEEVRQHVTLPECLVIGDTKLLAQTVMRKLRDQGLHFLAPLPSSRELDAEFLGLDPEGWQVLDYVTQQQAKLPPAERTQYLGQEAPWTWTHPGTGATEVFRRLYVISSEERATCRKVRLRRLVEAGKELNVLLEKCGKGRLKTREAVRQRAQKILEKRKVADLIRVSVRTVGGQPELDWEVDAQARTAAEALDGYYVLLCSWPTEQADASTLLRRWKQQWQLERRFHDWKGPLHVRPVFVTKPDHLAAFLLLLHLALMLFCLLEREARRALARRGQTKFADLLAGHVDAVPTGANILIAFEHLFLVLEEDPPHVKDVSEMSKVQENLWRLLGAQMPPAWSW